MEIKHVDKTDHPCLDVKDGKVVKGINFVGLKELGDPVELAKKYYEQGADELVFLDITATHEKRDTIVDLVEQVAKTIYIPLRWEAESVRSKTFARSF